MLILGIETSCDETAAAVVRDGRIVLSNVVVSQIDIFAEYGGVIPEVAARSHLEVVLPVVDKALSDAGCTWADIDAIAVTHAPGLLGSLLIGTLTARTLAILHDKPLYAVHHLKSHVYANWLIDIPHAQPQEVPTAEPQASTSSAPHQVSAESAISALPAPAFPLLALVVSGGHTQILYMREHNHFEIIGTTHDDAVGECFDKVAKILGLPYPGGPAIASAAKGILPENFLQKYSSGDIMQSAKSHQDAANPTTKNSSGDIFKNPIQPGDPAKYHLPIPKVQGLDFSFSGLKTAVLRAVQKEVGVPISHPSHKLKELLTPQQVCDFAASFEQTAVKILCEKLFKALELHPDTQSVVVAGGVSASQALRDALPEAYFPEPKYSGDNGAMVAAACYFEILSGVQPTDPYSLNIYPRIEIA